MGDPNHVQNVAEADEGMDPITVDRTTVTSKEILNKVAVIANGQSADPPGAARLSQYLQVACQENPFPVALGRRKQSEDEPRRFAGGLQLVWCRAWVANKIYWLV